jgi:prepilin-type N-terminal cleavage/methylation domain-containing protein
MRAVRRRRARHRAFTLVEMLVVIVLLGLAVGLAAPALRAPRPAADGLATLLPVAREAAVRRGETVYLRVAESGAWRLEGASSAADGASARGASRRSPGCRSRWWSRRWAAARSTRRTPGARSRSTR